MPSWKSKWGVFAFDDGWSRTIKIPAFDAFRYETGFKRPNPKGAYTIRFEANDEREFPSADMLHVFDQVLTNSQQLVPTIASALWEDFNGRGPNSRTWWHGRLTQVYEVVSAETRGFTLEKAADLLNVIDLQGITILREKQEEKGRPILNPSNGKVLGRVDIPYEPVMATLHFYAAFECEHGLDMLTDGKSVLGMGFRFEALLYPPN